MQSQADRLGLSHEFVAAVDGRTLTDEQRDAVDWSAIANDRQMRDEMLGCNFSHLAVYERIGAGDEAGLILEDDAALPADLLSVLAFVNEEIIDGEVVLLHYRASRYEPVRLDARDPVARGDMQLLRCTNAVVSSAAYVVTPGTARALIEGETPIQHPHDHWQILVERDVLHRIRCVYPRPVEIESSFKSQLGYVGEGTAARVSTFIARHRVFPFHQLLTRRRRRFEQDGSRFELVTSE